MNLLLDTCAFLWLSLRPERLGSDCREAIESPDSNIFLSSVVCWEIGLKYALGKLELPTPPLQFIPEARFDHGILPLSLNDEQTFALADLPLLHKDPFDRMLVCQALTESLTILSPDRLIAQYPVPTLW